MKFQLSGIILILVSLLVSTAIAQSSNAEIDQYEIRSYDPQKSGLVDLVFEARVEKLTDILNKTETFGKLVDVYFKIYWLSPSQYKIEVMGLPKGFQEVRDDLTALIKGKLELIIPEKFSTKFNGYTLKTQPLADGKLIKAIDDTYTLAIPEVDLVFDNNGKLKILETKSGLTAIKTEFFQAPKSWSNNKLVMEKMITTTKQTGIVSVSTSTIDYLTKAGMGFPSKVTIKNTIETVIPARGKEKEKKVKNESSSVLNFTTYEVNTGKAQRFIVEGLRK